MPAEDFRQLLSVIGSQRPRSFASSCVTYNGARDTKTLEAFLAAAAVYKSVAHTNDEDALNSLSLLLKDDAAIWWERNRSEMTTWADFERRLRQQFAPEREAYLIYADIIVEQQPNELTEHFIAKKRALFAELPPPTYPEHQQIDIFYFTLSARLKEKIPRESIETYDDLLKAAKAIEDAEKPVVTKKKKIRCCYCRMSGHTADVCRRKAKAEAEGNFTHRKVSKVPPEAVSEPQASQSTQIHQEEGTIDLMSFIRARPTVQISVGEITETAYVDSGARVSVASFKLYERLRAQGYEFEEEYQVITLADGEPNRRKVVKGKVPVTLCGRVVPTSFIVFTEPECQENSTLLSVEFIIDAGMVLNLAQLTWNFVDAPDVIYDLISED